MQIKMNKRRREKIEKRKRLENWANTVKSNYNNRCFIPECKCEKKINAHHIIPKEFEETRFDTENGIALCPGHHKFSKFSAHKNPLWFMNLLMEREPQKYKYLRDKILNIENGN